ncbi:hypothetical protein [Capnocytophaga catalasegens]|uniref:Uncharacterized protein n=1 Tax=Capnocytophaga catalasegens TaxID=1004260 RepID=A0AAV5ARH6_9FLAO|nr:hypothetical protein [Capnocytophaga catalasegens]GIZ14091.1 hypothetical protein RCZ03_00920 [Capnocytophaga catalasegens]GJM49089.1 hypothetical protein RCZ15_00650 [Capnocytophaga catalasegens]GJM52350.1 hypothetical protein RCZ16_06680 [Capnocytophaga catalasegens]
MNRITLKSAGNYMLYPLLCEIYIDGKFYDYFKTRKKEKVLSLPEGSKTMYIRAVRYTSNEILIDNLQEEKIHSIVISSKVQNFLFVGANVLMLSAMLLLFFQYISPYIALAIIIPYLYLAYNQIFKRKGLLTLEKEFVDKETLH